MGTPAPVLVAPRRESFDVICAGEPLWRAARFRRGPAAPAVTAGLLTVARLLARAEVRVGLATVLDDDRVGRNSLAALAAMKMNVDGVRLVTPVNDIVLVDATGEQSRAASERGVAPELEIPSLWSSQVLLLSGLSAATSRLAAFCKAARKARRDGAVVVLDVVGSLRHWAGREPRVISMVIREAHVVRCSVLDLAMIGMDAASVRRVMRPDATLVISDESGTTAIGTFGEARVAARRHAIVSAGFAEACTAAICAELARPGEVGESTNARWDRVLRDGAATRSR